MVKLRCLHVVVHAPSLFAEVVKSIPADTSASRVDSLVRHLLWPMLRASGEPTILNRVRLRQGAALLPYRILLCPLRVGPVPVGVIAVLREAEQPPFSESDLDMLTAAVPALQERLAARVDPVTGLLRWPAFELEVALRSRSAAGAAVVYADLDQIHAINEISGIQAGDEIIRDIGRLWQSQLPPVGSVATHLSGDCYVAVLFGRTLDQATEWAERAREAIQRLDVRGQQARVTASLGIAALTDASSFQHALSAAETACRVAKDRGRNRVEVYEAGDVTIVRRHAEVREARVLIDALEGDRLVLHAQPIVALNAPEARLHFEILLRIQEVDGRFVSVGEYLPAAERYQLLERLDRWVVEHVLQALAPRAGMLRALGASFAVNITGQSLSQPSFADFVRTEVLRSGIPAGLLDFEFTETAALRNLKATRRFIEGSADLGARIALDDFGTGLSSLVHLQELEVQWIKIDGRFIRDVLTNPRSQALVRALVQIARQLGLETVAEFVESVEVADHVRAVGVTYAQGYLYGRAQPLSETLARLQDIPAPAREANCA